MIQAVGREKAGGHVDTEMVAKGGWRATRPEVEGHAGFALNALLSPHANAAWGRLAAEYLAVHDAPDRLRTFKNLVLGEGWVEALDALEPAGRAGASLRAERARRRHQAPRLARAPDTVRFSSSLPLVWFEQLTAERRVGGPPAAASCASRDARPRRSTGPSTPSPPAKRSDPSTSRTEHGG